MSDEDRDRLTREILRRIQSLSRADKRTKASLAIRALDHGRERGVRDLIVYGEVLKVGTKLPWVWMGVFFVGVGGCGYVDGCGWVSVFLC